MLLSLLLHDFFVLALVYLLRTLLVGFRHLLAHDLSKGARTSGRVEPFLGLRLILRIFGIVNLLLGFNLL
jgi:hypothetical protein